MKHLLNQLILFFLITFNIFATDEIEEISVFKAKNHIGEYKIVCGKVKSTQLNRKINGVPLYFNFARDYPNSPFTAIIWTQSSGSEFGVRPDKRYQNRKLCVKGVISSYKGRPQIILRNSDQIMNQSH